MLISEGVTYDEETMTFPGASNILRFDFTLSTPFPADGEYEIDIFNREAGTNAVKFGISIAPLTPERGTPLRDWFLFRSLGVSDGLI